MGSTSVQIPPSLLQEFDRSAAERGVSRNRLIVASVALTPGVRLATSNRH